MVSKWFQGCSRWQQKIPEIVKTRHFLEKTPSGMFLDFFASLVKHPWNHLETIFGSFWMSTGINNISRNKQIYIRVLQEVIASNTCMDCHDFFEQLFYLIEDPQGGPPPPTHLLFWAIRGSSFDSWQFLAFLVFLALGDSSWPFLVTLRVHWHGGNAWGMARIPGEIVGGITEGTASR